MQQLRSISVGTGRILAVDACNVETGSFSFSVLDQARLPGQVLLVGTDAHIDSRGLHYVGGSNGYR